MADRTLKELERAWRATPDDEEVLQGLLAAHARAGADPRWELIAASPRWRRHAGFARKWFARPLEPGDGVAPRVLAGRERAMGKRLPRAIREWYLLAGARTDLDGVFDRRMPGDVLSLFGQWLPLFEEEQCVCDWSVRRADLAQEDPDVHLVFADDHEAPRPLLMRASDLFLAFMILEMAHGRIRLASSVTTLGYATRSKQKAWRAKAARAYATVPLRSFYGDDPDLRGDGDTLLVQSYRFDWSLVFTRTEAGRSRAVQALGAATEEWTKGAEFEPI